MACPPNSLRFNTTLCACNPGYLYNPIANNCTLFQSSPEDWIINSGIDYSITFPVTIFSFDSIKKFTKSQAVFLEATLVLLVSWLLFCLFVRFTKLGDGKSAWFRVRWWISRLDVCYGTRHWLDDQKVVRKRKTELGGTFSIASWILFIGLFAALLYQIISKRSVEVHNVRATSGTDLLSFINDMEFNITTISSMSCSHLRGLGTIVTGIPGSVDFKTSPLSTFANYSCHNTSQGPTVMLTCSSCKLTREDLHISWHFVDLPSDPAMAVGFHFNFTANNHHDRKRLSLVTGTVKNGSDMDDTPVTFRGSDVNILIFNLFPRLYRNLHDLRLIQPLFHEFIPGSSYRETSQLQASLQRSQDGLINTTLAISFLSSYIIEIDTENVWGPVSFLADLGGLYAISFAIFFYLLMQCEYRIKKLRNEDHVLLSIKNRTKAKQNWEKLRKYVMYTWGCSSLEDAMETNGGDSVCGCVGVSSFGKSGSMKKRKKNIPMDRISLNKKGSLPINTTTHPKPVHTHTVKRGTPPDLERGLPHSKVTGHEDTGVKMGRRKESLVDSGQNHVPQFQGSRTDDDTLPLPPILDFKSESETDMSDIQRNLQVLYEYNVLLREKFIDSQSKLDALMKRASDPH